MIGKKINQLATELAPTTTDLTIIGDPVTGVSKKITLEQLGAIFGGAVSFYTTLGDFPVTGVIDIIYCAKDTKKLYLWSGSAYVEVFPSQSLLDTYQIRSEKGNANGYASLDSSGKVPISQLPSSIMEYKGTWNAATNTPTLANGTGDTGDVYICNVAGTVNFGAGPITFAVGDYVIYSGTIWQRSSGAVGTVTSVAVSNSGDALAITGSPITTSGTINIGFAGTGAQYIKGDGTLATFPSIISQAQNLITEVYNNTGATLTKGTIVYINGGQGNLPTVTKALATGDSTSAQTFGVVQADITNMNNGYVVVAGKLSDLDTQAYTEGTQLYLSATTAGTWTSTKQYAPNHLVYIGIVVRAHPTQGIVEIKIQNGYELDEIHNVAAQSPDNNDILQYKTSTSLWTKVAGTTSNIAEGSNLYYTDARSRAALSFTAGSGAYNSTTGVITIPTNTNQLTNGAAFITLASLSAGAGISYNNTTGVIASTITQYTDALARAAISLTTTGTSGAATYNNTTGVLNIPQYQTALTNPVTGTGTTNYLPKFTGASTIGNSIVQDSGGVLSVAGRLSASGNDFHSLIVAEGSAQLKLERTATSTGLMYLGADNVGFKIFDSAFATRLTLTSSGNLGLGVTPSAWTGTNVKAFQFGNSGALANSGTFGTIVFNNSYYDGGYKYITSNSASAYVQDGSTHLWYQATSGTAGNAISFTQAMTLNASGNLSIGNTNDTYKLDVSGTGRFTSSVTATQGIFRNSGVPAIQVIRDLNVVSVGTAGQGIEFGALNGSTPTAGAAIYGTLDNPATTGALVFQTLTAGSLTTKLTIASTGAATFSSSVTANVLNTYGSGGLNSTAYQLNASISSSASASSVAPIARFSNNGGGYVTKIMFSDNNRGDAFITHVAGSAFVPSTRWLGFGVDAVDQMIINASGNVGIGTTSPSSLLHTYLANGANDNKIIVQQGSNGYASAINLIANNDDGGRFNFINSSTNGGTTHWQIGGGGVANTMVMYTAGNERMRITSGGAVQIAQTIQTGAPANGTAQPWKLGNAVSGTVTPSHYLVVEINGQSYTINAFNGFP